jgi:hypothetical protein
MRLIILCLLISTCCFSQTRISGDTLYLANGLTFVEGEDLHLGMGSNASTKGFNFVYTSPFALSGQTFLGSNWANMKMKIKNFKKYGNRRTGDKFYIVLGGGNIVNYWCEIEQALTTGEVIDDRLAKKTDSAAPAASSLADELKKLKDLLDSGALTKEEYDAAKKKLLGN